MSRDIRILSTKKLKSDQKRFLLNAGFSIIDADFIRVTELPFRLTDVAENLIVTSQNAAKALATHPEVQDIRRNPVFCVGSKTADLLDELGFTVQETANNAQELADVIIKDYATENFTFFSGNIRRNELPMALMEADVEMNEIEVYETELTPIEINSEIDGILFFSPSAVEGYLRKNKLTDQVCFCIGKTTASAVEGANPSAIMIISKQPTIESTIAKCINHFNQEI
ncbi:uroporphyrinogen-III synthase [Flavobacterium sp. MAH-1]|uniref:Uroporphyrinogen-III synthase n=1 Tax=Flavobacterium agri TaxID=2743471 RepID=A0A7Y8Y0A2_9FLAO|nr:uroporphyrinogen-III synthase [Flavobacterium agri]NUY80201.1 uroporphyrinogen-III synthase [Flavobacterium agri]NYA70226.1 uroporphyrinogen-III synthase [Flavobacterium agri]